MSTTKLTNYDRATIVEWYDDGLYSQRELAEIYGVSRATIRRVIEDNRNFCGRTGDDLSYEVGLPSDDYVGLPPAQSGPVDPDKTHVRVVIGLIVVTYALVGYIGWVLYNAVS